MLATTDCTSTRYGIVVTTAPTSAQHNTVETTCDTISHAGGFVYARGIRKPHTNGNIYSCYGIDCKFYTDTQT